MHCESTIFKWMWITFFEDLPVSFHWCELQCLFMSWICLLLYERECHCVQKLLLCRCC